jgi:hypothetical protein
VGLAAERPLDCSNHVPECCRVRRVLQSVEQGCALSGRQIKLARASIGNVDGNDPIHFLTVWLDSHW